ncbi:DUF2378 family protein [Corallococcus sp. RDP092CA]|uniref:DUF2378 family protein n=1 Tax=Corallococcus sp. RDP092CA TaxID=3109369 RepID=UPI0035AF0522
MSPQDEVVFGHTVEGLLVALDGHLDAALRARLKDAGLDVEGKRAPAYPKAQWYQWLRISAEALFPGVPLPQAHWQLGERFIEAYFSTSMGRALQAVLKILGPARTLERTTRNMASGSNFVRVDVERLGPTDYRLKVNDAGLHPEFFGALCHFGTLTTGVQGLTTVVEAHAAPSATYRMRW